MKNFILIILLIIATNSNAQLYLGPEIGTNFLPVRDNQLGKDYHIGLHGGLNAEFRFTDYFSVKSGLYFTQKKQSYSSYDTSAVEIFGFDLEGLIPGVNFEEFTAISGIITQSYIQMPLMASYTYQHLNISAGPFFGFMVHAWTKEETLNEVPLLNVFDMDSIDPSGLLSSLLPPASSTGFTESSSKENLRIFDYGFKTAIAYRMDNFSVNLSYLFSVPDYRIERGEIDLQRHSYFQASFNYNFKIGQSNPNTRY